MGTRPSRHTVETVRKILSDLDEAVDPKDPALVSLKNLILSRVADIEVSRAETALAAPSSPTPEC